MIAMIILGGIFGGILGVVNPPIAIMDFIGIFWTLIIIFNVIFHT